MKGRSGFELLLLVAGPVIWLIHYLSIYAVNAIACARYRSGGWMGLPPSSWIILAAGVSALAGMAATALYQHRRVRFLGLPGLHRWLTDALCLLSGVAVAWETLPILTTSACG
ncbi:hypothetical protein ACXIUT_16720 [Achromobacter denitrificans]